MQKSQKRENLDLIFWSTEISARLSPYPYPNLKNLINWMEWANGSVSGIKHIANLMLNMKDAQ